jgi:sodium-dependent dicarboxylate transporter 2/3/5
MQVSCLPKLFSSAALLALPPALVFGFDIPHPAVLSIFLSIVGLWVFEPIPLAATGLLVPVLAVLYGVTSANVAFDAFGGDILFLFLGCFLLGLALEKHGLDKRLAYFLLSRCMPGTSFLNINVMIAATTFVLSMWISNTSATAIMTAITLGVLRCLEREVPEAAVRHAMSLRLLLGCAFAASIGGLATPVGSPPNLIALKLLAQHGIVISFGQWMAAALPVSLLMLAMMLFIFHLYYPLPNLNFPRVKEEFARELTKLGPLKIAEKQVAVVFILVILLWIFAPLLPVLFPNSSALTALSERLSMSVVALSGALILFFLPISGHGSSNCNLHWSETAKVDWGTLLLFGGGLTLGALLEQSGAAKDVSAFIFAGPISSPLLVGSIVVGASILLSEFSSNTAAASILIPLILGATLAQGMSTDITTALVLAATFGASFGFMFPVSTPPNAIVYGTGKVPALEMRKVGFLFDLAGASIIIVYVLIF